jgi:thiol-disulfide isomerase/thioredoxin
MSTSEVELFALEDGVKEVPYSIGEPTDLPIRLKTSHRLTSDLLDPFKNVPVRSVWLMGKRHTDHDVALVAEMFNDLMDLYVPFAPALTDEACRSLIPRGEHFRAFGVRRSRITDEGAKVLASFPELRVLHLNHSQITDVGLSALGACRDLVHLFLDGNRSINGSGFAAFADHPALRAVFARGTAVDDDAVGHLSTCSLLGDLHLSSTRATERCLLTLRQQGLEVSLPREIDQERLDGVRVECPDLIVNGIGPEHVIDIPRAKDGAPVELPASLRGYALTFAMFTSPSCGPCGWLKTTYDLVPPALREQFKYVEIAIEDELDLASALGIRSVPTVLILQFGIVLQRFTGAVKVEQLTEYLEAALSA